MTYYDNHLKELQDKMARRRHLQTLLQDLHKQEKELSHKVFELKEMKYKEDADVSRLEGGSLANYFYHMIGRHEEKLAKERGEAYQAAVKYDMANLEWEQVKQQAEAYEKELRTLRGCEQEYEVALREKLQTIKTQNSSETAQILKLQEELAQVQSQRKELKEAIMAGKGALSRMDDLMSSLNSAESWGTWDVFGGGIFADMAKYSHLDEAQDKIERLQLALRSFKTELADVMLDADIQIEIDNFTRFADWAFDNIFTDWSVLDKIQKAQGQVFQKYNYVESTLEKLESMLCQTEQREAYLKTEVESKIIQIQI